jgi:hypothetical protein
MAAALDPPPEDLELQETERLLSHGTASSSSGPVHTAHDLDGLIHTAQKHKDVRWSDSDWSMEEGNGLQSAWPSKQQVLSEVAKQGWLAGVCLQQLLISTPKRK